MDDELKEIIENTELPIKWENPKPVRVGDGVKRKRQMAFLAAYKTCGMVSKACQMAGINQSTERAWRNSADAWYSQQFKDAGQQYRELIEEEIHHRAIEGEEQPIIGKVQTELGPEDRIIGTKRVKSDLLLMFHAKRHIPEYRDKYETPKEEGNKDETVSPIMRITMRLDMIGERKQESLPLDTSSENIIDVTPEPEVS